MGTWKDHIEKLNSEWTGKKVMYEGNVYNVAFVDYNGIIHIDRPTEHNQTMAVYEPYEAKKVLVQ